MVPVRHHARDWLAYVAFGGLALIFLLQNKNQEHLQEQVGSGQNQPRPDKWKQPSGASLPPRHDGWNAEQSEHHRKERSFWWASIIVTGLAAIGAGASAVLAWQAVKGGQESVRQARRQADTARTQLEESRSPISERPFVFIEPGSPNYQEWRRGKAGLNWPYTFVNYGKTPAVLTRIYGNASITDKIPPFLSESYQTALDRGVLLPPNIYVIDESTPPGTIISAGGKTNIYTAHGDHVPLRMENLPPEEAARRQRLYMAATPGGSIRFWLIGRIEYEDTWSRKFFTNFCIVMNPSGDTVTQGGAGNCNERE